MGRCIRPMQPQAFLAIENGDVPAPYPRQQHFWCGIVYWNKTLSSQRYIWFIKLPVDERGCLVDAARQHFLEKVFTALASAQSGDEVDLAKTEQNTDNPYIFTPNQQQLADFNAQTRALIGLSPCADYRQALNYFKAPYVQDWQNISLQGLADVIAFCDDETLNRILSSTLDKLSNTVRQHLFSSLESKILNQQQVELLSNTIDWQLTDETNNNIFSLRALALMPDEREREKLVESALHECKSISKDLLMVIAGRHWTGLNDTNMMQFLEKAAELDTDKIGFEFFCSLFADIAQLPQSRNSALKALRNPNRSAQLSSAIGALFKQKSA